MGSEWHGPLDNRNIKVNLDSQIIVNKMKQPITRHQPYYFIVKECQQLAFNQNWTVSIQHCYREANRVADHLTNLGVDQTAVSASFEFPQIRLSPS